MAATTLNPLQKAVQIRIDRAMALPGAKGKRGFLLWVNAAFPKKVADAVALAAAKHIPSGGLSGYMPRTQWKSPAMFDGFGDDSLLTSFGVDSIDLTPSTAQAIADSTDSSAPTTSWVSDVASAFSSVFPVLAQAGIAKQQLQQQQTLFNTNLQLAQQRRPLITSDISKYTSVPTVNFGLSGTTQSALVWGLGALGGAWLITSFLGRSRRGGRSRKH